MKKAVRMLEPDVGRHQPTPQKPKRLLVRHLSCLAFLLVCVHAGPAFAHEFWMWPNTFAAPTGAGVRLQLFVGEQFEGSRAGFATSHAAAMRHYSAKQTVDLSGRIPAGRVLPEFVFPMPGAGAHMLAYDSHPAFIELSADKFHAYLNEEGLQQVIRQRESAGVAANPAREQYRRHIKTLLQADGKTDDTFAVQTGQRLEIVPLANPHHKAAGDRLGFQLLFEGKPLAGALVKAWHRKDDQTLTIRARTSDDGKVSFSLPHAGGWMISAVHMIPSTETATADWESFWGNLTFLLPGR